MKFTIRELLWLTAFVVLVLVQQLDRIATRDRELVIERLAHKIDSDVHDHLKGVSDRLTGLEGWADGKSKQEADGWKDYHEAQQRLGNVEYDVQRIKEALIIKGAKR